jgi:hypothetical protein
MKNDVTGLEIRKRSIQQLHLFSVFRFISMLKNKNEQKFPTDNCKVIETVVRIVFNFFLKYDYFKRRMGMRGSIYCFFKLLSMLEILREYHVELVALTFQLVHSNQILELIWLTGNLNLTYLNFRLDP